MSFKDELLDKIKLEFSNDLKIKKAFDELSNWLHELEDDIEEFIQLGLDANFYFDSEHAEFVIQDRLLRFDIIDSGHDVHIQVTGGEKGHDILIDKIRVRDGSIVNSDSSELNLETAFDYYLRVVFKELRL